MNDRFKFRAWDIEEKKYNEVIGLGVCRSCLPDGYVKNETQIFEQCTGLKDKNGKLIYEGDIVKIDEDLATINWSIYSARFMLDSEEDFFSFDSFYAEDCEVIGNIHKNPELLEVNND